MASIPSNLSKSKARAKLLSALPVSPKELYGWYLYAWAAEPFIVSAVGTYVPLLLEQFARNNGVLVKDHLTPCVSDSIENPGFPPPGEVAPSPQNPTECVVYVFGKYIDTSSYALYTFSISVLVQTLVVISMSGAADRGHFRKTLLISFGIVGSLITMLFYFITQSNYYLASIFAIISNSMFGGVSVCGNAFLPVLVENHPETIENKIKLIDNIEEEYTSHQQLIDSTILSAKISGTGASLGYISAFIVQIFTIGVILKTGSTTLSIQLTIFLVGIWWFIFQIPLHWLLHSRPGPKLPKSYNKKTKFNKFMKLITFGSYDYILYGWKTLFLSIKQVKTMRDVGVFLIGWFVVSDSFTTINSAAILFARSQLQMSTAQLGIIGLLVMFSAISGAILIPRFIQPFFNLSPTNCLNFIIIWACLIPIYGVLGFYTDVLGLKNPFEMYGLAIWYGFALGGLNSIARSLFSVLIPKGKESTFFSLFAVTDKGSSIIGPLITGMITDKTHNIRYAFYLLLILLILSVPIFNSLDVERGRDEAMILERVDEEEDSINEESPLLA